MSAITTSFTPSSKVIEEIALDALALVWALGLPLDESSTHKIEDHRKRHALVPTCQLFGGGDGAGPALW